MDMHDSDVLDLPIQDAVWLWFFCWKTLDKYYYKINKIINKIIILHARLWHVRKVIKIDTVPEQKKKVVSNCTYDIGCYVLLDKCKKIL